MIALTDWPDWDPRRDWYAALPDRVVRLVNVGIAEAVLRRWERDPCVMSAAGEPHRLAPREALATALRWCLDPADANREAMNQAAGVAVAAGAVGGAWAAGVAWAAGAAWVTVVVGAAGTSWSHTHRIAQAISEAAERPGFWGAMTRLRGPVMLRVRRWAALGYPVGDSLLVALDGVAETGSWAQAMERVEA